jgi:hypothetical protein
MPASIDDILQGFSKLSETDPEKAAWLRTRLETFTEELALAIEKAGGGSDVCRGAP